MDVTLRNMVYICMYLLYIELLVCVCCCLIYIYILYEELFVLLYDILDLGLYITRSSDVKNERTLFR